MCYSAAMDAKRKKLEDHYQVVAKLPDFVTEEDLQRHHINGFAKQLMGNGTKESLHPMMLVMPQENKNFLAFLMWGLIPHWELGEHANDYYKSTLPYGSGLNAKSEKLFSSAMYEESAFTKRCIVPLTGFYEPHTARDKGKDFKVPFTFKHKESPFLNLAGIYAFTKDGHATFSILTKAATPLFSKIHNKKKRRPVILADAQIDAWLANSATRDDLQQLIDNDLPDDAFTAYPVSKDLYRPKVDSNKPGIATAVHYPQIEIDYDGKPQQGLF